MMLHLLWLSLLAAPCSSQLMYYYLYPSYYPTTPALQYQQSPAYATPQQYICGTAPNYQYQATPCTSANPACERECQSTHYCQRFESAAACVNGCCNSTQPTSNTNFYNPYQNNQNSNGIARDNGVNNGINDITCPFNDPSAGVCIDGNCPSGFVCNLENVCCPCAVGAAQGACSAGGCSSSALRCEAASSMCCPRPMNGSASADGAAGSPYAQLQYTQGLQQQRQQYPQQQQQYGNQQQFEQQQQQQYPEQQQYDNQQQFQPQQQQQYPQQQVPLEPYPPQSQQYQYQQQGGQFQQQPYGSQQQQPQFNFNDEQNQYQQPQQQPGQFDFDSQNQNQFQQQQNLQQGGQFQQPNQQQPQFNQQFNGQQQPDQPRNQFQQSQIAQNPTTPIVYNTQNPNPTFSPVSPQTSSTTIPTIYPSSG